MKDTPKTENAPALTEPGFYLRGTPVSSTARLITRKDKSGQFVRVVHELALQPGIAHWEENYEPTDDGIEVKDGEVKRFPKLEAFKQLLVKVGRIREYNGKTYVSGVTVLA